MKPWHGGTCAFFVRRHIAISNDSTSAQPHPLVLPSLPLLAVASCPVSRQSTSVVLLVCVCMQASVPPTTTHRSDAPGAVEADYG